MLVLQEKQLMDWQQRRKNVLDSIKTSKVYDALEIRSFPKRPKVLIGFSRPKDLIGKVIEFLTGFPFVHCGLLAPGFTMGHLYIELTYSGLEKRLIPTDKEQEWIDAYDFVFRTNLTVVQSTNFTGRAQVLPTWFRMTPWLAVPAITGNLGFPQFTCSSLIGWLMCLPRSDSPEELLRHLLLREDDLYEVSKT